MSREDMWMTVKDVMAELHYDNVEAARKWIARRRAEKKVAVVYRGTALLVARKDVENVLIQSASRRRQRKSAGEVQSPGTRVVQPEELAGREPSAPPFDDIQADSRQEDAR